MEAVGGMELVGKPRHGQGTLFSLFYPGHVFLVERGAFDPTTGLQLAAILDKEPNRRTGHFHFFLAFNRRYGFMKPSALF